MKWFVVFFIFGLLAVSFVSADLIDPSQKGLSIMNIIMNIQDFPDYVFIESGHESIGFNMCPPRIIGSDGVIVGGYKFCDINVYIVERSRINENDFPSGEINAETDNEFNKIWDTLEAKIIIRNIEHYDTVPIVSTESERTYTYEINPEDIKDIEKIKTSQRSILFYIYILIPILALIIIVFIIKKRKK